MPCRAIDNEGAYELVEVAGERVDSLIREDVLLIKLDVEGFEPTAFRSSSGLLDHQRCEYMQSMLAEYTACSQEGRRALKMLSIPSCLCCAGFRMLLWSILLVCMTEPSAGMNTVTGPPCCSGADHHPSGESIHWVDNSLSVGWLANLDA